MTTFENFSQELSAIDLEIARLAQLCDIDLTAPGVIEAVLHNQQELCPVSNDLAWEKLRGLLVLHFHVVLEEAQTDGVDAAAASVRNALQNVAARLKPVQQ
ncbi:hypothetical protein [Zoogloea sp.]|uniref:hypothetical protein n=1 Tax=Zoogloea sp. TaxID=49181 RepID=UPI0035B4CFA9|nr:hypothetical protein [Rhodocyclales bacterium]